jgi:TonB family protein
LVSCGLPRVAAAQDAGAAPQPATDAQLVAPMLLAHVTAAYPAQALSERAEGSVGLELLVDETGHVLDVHVTSPAGHGFDEAAIAAARRFTFSPATKNGVPIRSSLQFNYDFRLPPSAASLPATVVPLAPPQAPRPTAPAAQAPAAKTAHASAAPVEQSTAAPAATPAEGAQTGADQSTLVLASRPISAASSLSVRDRDFALRPVGSVQDILRVTPGLVLVQHSGGGKANQYFLRGFDADHGTDIALSIDGVPINMASHAHGQGFSDTNFIIPEVVERVEITKGPYFANQGDFATAGAVNMVSRTRFKRDSVAFGFGGSPDHGGPGYRALVIASPDLGGSTQATFAAELGHSDGPFDHPENWDKLKLWNKLTFALTPTSSLSVSEMSYGSSWHGSGQIPARAVEQGSISRFGSIDPSEGGGTARHQVYVQYKLRPNEHSELSALAYLGAYRFNLFSDFTLFLQNPTHGDEIEQIDRRTFYGAKLSYRVMHEVSGGLRFYTTIGADTRSDDIHEELWNTVERVQTHDLRSNDVHETIGGLYANEELSPSRWLRIDLGGRADLLTFAVDDRSASADPSAPKSGTDGAHQLSPKASIIVSPVQKAQAQLDVYVNYGNGFHSNDVRGAFTTPSVTPLTRALGEELGSRARLWNRWDLAVALWTLHLDHETVWNGDDGTTSVSGATTRRGVELETRYEFTPWLAADLDVTFTHSAFVADHGNGNGLALAPKQTWSGGLSARHPLGPGMARGGLRFYGIGNRPASNDGVITAPGFNQFDLHLGYRYDRFDLAFDVENLLNGDFRSAQFDTVSRLRSDPAIGAPIPAGLSCGANGRLASRPGGGPNGGRFYGCEGVDFTPAYPWTARVTATLYLD